MKNKDSIKELKDFVDKVTGKKDVSLIDELLGTNTGFRIKHKSTDIDEFDSPEEFAEEYADDFDDEDEAMDEYEDEL